MIDVTEPFEAQRILESFRQGTVSAEHARRLMIGREFWIDAINEDLDFVAKGASKIRFLSAPYGGGKSHFLASINDVATEKGFLVAHVELHSREAPLDRFDVIFPKIMRSLRCKTSSQVLDEVFTRWLQVAQLYDRQSINEETRKISSSLDFQAALRTYVERADSDFPEDREIIESVFGWLCGDSLSTILRKNTRIRNRITVTNASEVFGSFLALIRRAGFSGLAMFLDEAEAVTSLAQSRRRNEANQNLRKLLDNADRHIGFMIVFATTPTFLEDPERGAQSYPALWGRIRTVLKMPKGTRPNKRNLIIRLEPPGKRELKKAGKVIIDLHSVAYSWAAREAFPDSTLNLLVVKYMETTQVRVYRSFLRTLVGILDSLEQASEDLVTDGLIGEALFEDEI